MAKLIADALGGQLDLALVRKVGAPGNPELAVGAIDEHGTIHVSGYASQAGADPAYLQEEAARQLALIRQHRARYGQGRPPIDLAGRTVIVVDDGLATGATMMAALEAADAQQPQRLVCAVPIASPSALEAVATVADDVVCLAAPESFRAVSQFYRRFPQVEDDEVVALLSPPAFLPSPGESTRAVHVPAGARSLEGALTLPREARGVVLFAHGSGSSRHSPRNRAVASALNHERFATLLLDLLTPAEDLDPVARFDVPLLAERLEAALDFVRAEPALAPLPVGVFGASTGAAAALTLAATRSDEIDAVVSRGGRPDLAGDEVLSQVLAPTLLIVGELDDQVLGLNQAAQALIAAPVELAIVAGATHLFEEAGALEKVAKLAGAFFAKHLK